MSEDHGVATADVAGPRRPDPPRRPWLRDALHVFALCGFAFAQPLFDVLGKNPSFFLAHGTDARGIVLFAVALALVPALVIVGVLAIVRAVAPGVGRALHVVTVGLLAAAALLPFLASAKAGMAVTSAVVVISAVGASVAYARLAVIRRYVTLLAVAPILFVVLFLTTSAVRTLLFDTADSGERAALRGELRTPVVMLLMDEFAQGAILTPDGDIDEDRFPQFARLARASTWYPNATTQSNATNVAVPTILTGRYPRLPSPPPVHAAYPDNLLALLSDVHPSVIDEWVTGLCPITECRHGSEGYGSKHLAADSALVYMHAVLPDRLKGELPPLGLQWAGFFANPADNEERIARFPSSVRPVVRLVMGWLDDDDFRAPQVHRLRRFLASLRATDRPSFAFAHLGLPHTPWHLLPDARPYNRQDTPGIEGANSRWTDANLADAGLQRYELQVKAMDTLLGEFMDALEDRGLWDDALVVVLADHGVAFDRGHSTRAILGSEGSVLSIPMFVRYPGQTRGRVDDRNAELIDIAPTVADVAGIDLPWKVDGSSLAGPDPKRTKKRVWAGFALPPFDLDIVGSKTEISERIRDLFGERRRDDLFAFGPHRSLVGRRLSGLPLVENRSGLTVELDDAQRWTTYDPAGDYVPARPSGQIRGGEPPPWMAVALNGRIAGLGRPFVADGRRAFQIMVSDRYLERGRNDLRFFGVDDDGALYEIERTS